MIRYFLIAMCTMAIGLNVKAQTITTFAGNGTMGNSGDGGQATAASFYYISDVAIDKNNDVLILDEQNAVIRKVNTVSGFISTIAGTAFNHPSGIATDNVGNIYVADNGNLRVRKIDINGIVTTIAGTGVYGYSGDGGQAINATFKKVFYLAIDNSGNLFVSDYCAVRKIDPSGVITTVAGNGVAGFSGDGGSATSASLNNNRGIRVDNAGNLYVADVSNNRIRMVNQSGTISTFAGNGTAGYSGDGGQASNAKLSAPYYIACDADNNLLVADRGNNVIRRISASGVINTIAGNGVIGFSGDAGPAAFAQLNSPSCLCVDSFGNMLIGDYGNFRVRKVDAPTALAALKNTVNNLQIFPSPNNGTFTLSGTAETIGAIQFEITDVTGKIVLKDNAAVVNGKINKLVSLDNSTPAGQYFLRIMDKSNNATVKFEKK